jgi:hypothetical protein
LDLSGVAGGIDMHPDFEAGRLVPTVVPLFLLTTAGRSSTVIVKCFLESATGCVRGPQSLPASAGKTQLTALLNYMAAVMLLLINREITTGEFHQRVDF